VQFICDDIDVHVRLITAHVIITNYESDRFLNLNFLFSKNKMIGVDDNSELNKDGDADDSDSSIEPESWTGIF
jgi:hypothetical protein